MNPIDLTGLRADVPIGAMAAFGCLRICERTRQFQGSKLSWTSSGSSYHAVLWTAEGAGLEELVAALLEDVKGVATRPELVWSEQIKTATEAVFRASARQALELATTAERGAADWFAAFGSELAVEDGKIEPTPFDMSVARQKFLADGLRLAGGLAAGQGGGNGASAEAYREALFGPWKYKDDQHSLGWDPSTMKLGAFTYKAPTTMANAGVRAAVWLAFESLPLFPCFYSRGLQTRAFRRRGRELSLCWPVWQGRVSVAALGSLLGCAALVADSARSDELLARGVIAIYRSARFKPNKYLASFRTAELAFGGAAERAG